MAKTYLRFVHKRSFGVIASQKANILLDKSGKLVIAGALESIIIWNLKTGQSIATMYDKSIEIKKHGEVTKMVMSPGGKRIAAGYSNGVIRIWDLEKREVVVEFKGHQKAITALTFDTDGAILFSGSLDTHIVVWDIVAESGRVRLKGHKNAVTDIVCLSKNVILSSSKDTLMKVWDLDTQHCIQTVVGHRSEVWSIDSDSIDSPKYVVTGSADLSMRVWKIDTNAARRKTSTGVHSVSSIAPAKDMSCIVDGDEENTKIVENETDIVKYWGSLGRQGSGRVGRLRYGLNGKILAVASAGKTIELYAIRNDNDVKKKVARRRKRAREKSRKEGKTEAEIENDSENVIAAQPADMMELLTVIRTDQKINGFDFCKTGVSLTDEEEEKVTLVLSMSNNSVLQYDVSIGDGHASGAAPRRKVNSLLLGGHRSDVRSVSLSSDDSMILSTSAASTKIWNSRTQECIRTVNTGFALCGAFCPGNRHIVVGTKKGELQIIDIASSEVIQKVDDAHRKAIWSLAVRPDGRGIVTGSADKEVKFWDFELVAAIEGGIKRLAVVHTRTLKMSDDVLCVKFSHTKDPTTLLLAVSLLDCTVKVFYEDTLKFFLSLYGHKLPVMDMDISSDNTILATASADKNVKLWGLDFGDCHKSLFAHADSVMAVAFVPGTHYFFTSGKDNLIKYWDADKFEQILTLEGHFGEVWSLAVSGLGDFVVSGSHDRSIRYWERTEEQVFVDEERERELEDLFEADLDAPEFNHGAAPDGKESGAAGQRSVATVKAAERLIEAMQLAEEEQAIVMEQIRATKEAEEKLSRAEREERLADPANAKELVARPAPSMQLLGRTPVQHVLYTIQYIKPADLEEALIVLPFNEVVTLISYLEAMVESGERVELVTKCVFFLLKVHHRAIISNRMLLLTLNRLKQNTRLQLQRHRDRMGFNIAAMNCFAYQKKYNTGHFTIENDEEPVKKKQKMV